MKTRGYLSKQFRKTACKDMEEEATAAAIEISMDTAMVAALSELDVTFSH